MSGQLSQSNPLRIVVVGLRGVPDVQGGIETHCQHLYPNFDDQRYSVVVYARRQFVARSTPYRWHGLTIKPVWAPGSVFLEALVHTVLCLLRQVVARPDVVHIHGIGPGIATPLARLLGLRVVVTQHGRDYEREKWGRLARGMLRLGETLSMRFSDRLICVARNDARRLNERFGTDKAVAIPNGVPEMAPPSERMLLDSLGIGDGRYFVNVARWVPEKRQIDLITAFKRAKLSGWKLVLVGSAMHGDVYGAKVREALAQDPDIIVAGHRSGAELSTLFAGAAAFVLPSAVEGLPITILEALSYGLPCIVSDIPANREFPLPSDAYFPVGDVEALAARLIARARDFESRLEDGAPTILREPDPARLPLGFQWPEIARQTQALLTAVSRRRDADERTSGAAVDGIGEGSGAERAGRDR